MLCIVFIFFLDLAYAQDVGRILSRSDFKHVSVGISVRSMETMDEIVSVDSKKLLSPASTLKTVTSIVGLSMLGADYRFSTSIGHTGNVAPDGTLEGDLIITGGGDPTLGSKRWKGRSLDELLVYIVATVSNAGIRCINGAIIVDTHFLKGQNIPDQWKWYDLGNYYASGAWSLNVNENLYHIYFDENVSVGERARVHHIEPSLSQVRLDSRVITAKKGSGDNAYIYGAPFQKVRIIRGTIPYSSNSFSIKGSMPNPPLAFAELIERKLSNNAISASEGYLIGHPKGKVIPIKTYTSPPLSKIIQLSNYKSINLYCDALFRLIGKQSGGDGSITSGINAVEKWLDANGYPSDELILKDGSGLSSENKITPALLSLLLAKNPAMKKYLPQVGKQGTVRSLLKNNPIAEDFRLKSGSFEGVLAYAGYLTGSSKKRYSISVIVNNYSVPYFRMKGNIEKLLSELHAGL